MAYCFKVVFFQDLSNKFQTHRNFRTIVNQKVDETLLKNSVKKFAPTSKGVLFVDKTNGHIFLQCTSFKGSRIAQFLGTMRHYRFQPHFHLSAMELK